MLEIHLSLSLPLLPLFLVQFHDGRLANRHPDKLLLHLFVTVQIFIILALGPLVAMFVLLSMQRLNEHHLVRFVFGPELALFDLFIGRFRLVLGQFVLIETVRSLQRLSTGTGV